MTTERLDGWAYMVRSHREKEAAEKAANPGPDLRGHEVVEDGHQIPAESVSKRTNIGKVAALAIARGWEVRCGLSKYRTADRVVKGVVVQGEVREHRWVQGVLDTHHFTASTGLIVFDGWPVGSLEELKVGLDECGTR